MTRLFAAPFLALFVLLPAPASATITVYSELWIDAIGGDTIQLTAYGYAEDTECWGITVEAYLLERGAQLEATDPAGWSALFFAANANHLDSVNALLTAGADAHRRDVEGHSIEDAARLQRFSIPLTGGGGVYRSSARHACHRASARPPVKVTEPAVTPGYRCGGPRVRAGLFR